MLDANLVVGNLPEKIEGIAILDKWTVALGNDNDFAFDTFDGEGNFKIKTDQLCEPGFEHGHQPFAPKEAIGEASMV